MRSVKETIGRFASSKLPVLILGETGPGKELVAQALHDLSGRKGRFLGVNCSAVPDNLFESTFFGHRKGAFTGAEADSGGLLRECQGGTLLLDEIGELSAQAQAKLLRFLEEGRVRPVGDVRDVPVEVRIVAATNAPIREMEQAGKFRSDLLARLEGVVLELPPLGERRDDIPLLISALGREAGCPSPTIEPDALEAVMVAAWPRNVRGLRTLLLRLAESSGGEAGGPDGAWKIRLKDLPGELSDPVTHRRMAPLPPPAQGDDRPPREELERVLADFGGNVAGVAQHYGRHRRQVYRWLERYGLKAGLDGSGGRKI
jgi:two-component system NtrC family response regulator